MNEDMNLYTETTANLFANSTLHWPGRSREDFE